MTKSELIDAVALRADVAKSTAEKVVNCVFDAMVASLERGDDIEIRGFGRFSVRQYGWYVGRNPKTNQTVPVPPKRLPYFKPGKDLKELVDQEDDDSEFDDDDREGSDAAGSSDTAGSSVSRVPANPGSRARSENGGRSPAKAGAVRAVSGRAATSSEPQSGTSRSDTPGPGSSVRSGGAPATPSGPGARKPGT